MFIVSKEELVNFRVFCVRMVPNSFNFLLVLVNNGGLWDSESLGNLVSLIDIRLTIPRGTDKSSLIEPFQQMLNLPGIVLLHLLLQNGLPVDDPLILFHLLPSLDLLHDLVCVVESDLVVAELELHGHLPQELELFQQHGVVLSDCLQLRVIFLTGQVL